MGLISSLFSSNSDTANDVNTSSANANTISVTVTSKYDSQNTSIGVEPTISGYVYELSTGKYVEQKGKGVKVYVIDNKKKYTELSISHDNFCYIAGVVKSEDSFSIEGSKNTTQTGFNLVKVLKGHDLSISDQAKWAKHLFASGYSTVKSKVSLTINDRNASSNNARAGLIHVLLELEDNTMGAIAWDGIDFAEKGANHSKARLQGISITKEIWDQFIDVCDTITDSKGIVRLNRNPQKPETNMSLEDARKTIPFLEIGADISFVMPVEDLVKIYPNAPTASLVDTNLFESTGSGNNKGRTLYKAVAVRGKQIFWAVDKNHPNNKGYGWKYFASWLNGKTILLFLLAFLSVSCKTQINEARMLQENTGSGKLLIDTLKSSTFNYIDTIYKLRNGYSLSVTINQKDNNCTLRLSGKSINEDYYNHFLIDVIDFDSCFAVTSKVGSNVYFSLYNKFRDETIIEESIPYVLDEKHQIILYYEMNYVNIAGGYINPEYRDFADFSLYDITRKKKQFVINPFGDCKNPYYGSLGSYNDIIIRKVNFDYIYLQYKECETSIQR